jgi:mannobiose 2-epimerase
VRTDRPRGALLASRILWTYCAAFRTKPDPKYLELAKAAYMDLESHFWDREHAGYFWSIAPDGKPLDNSKQIYVQSFAIYGLTEYFRATGDKAALDRAIEVYRLIESHSRDRANGGYLEAFTRDWRRPKGKRLSKIGPEYPKSQNTNLHLMESFTNLLRVWPDSGLRQELRALTEVMLTRIVGPEGLHLRLYFDAEWNPKSDVISFGHDIEFSWLVTETAEVVGDPELLARAKTAALKIARGTLAQGVDPDGGVLNEAGPRGLTDTGKDWWPQAEAVVGFLNAYQLSGDPQFFAAAERTWNFIERRLVDRQHGEWFWGVTREGKVRPYGTKIGFWKCPYHNGRACLETAARLRALAAPPVPEAKP